jgi:hypothetical protein
MKIEKLNLLHLRNDAHFQFHTEFRDLMMGHNPQILKVKPQFDVYMTLYEREDEALKKILKSALTEKIQEADRARDELFAGMVYINNGMCRHFIKETAEAAQRIKIVLDTYGNVAKKPLNEETSAVYNLLQDLKSDKYAKDAADSGIDVWANELEKRNAAFESLVNNSVASASNQLMQPPTVSYSSSTIGEKKMKKSKLTLTAIALTAMALTSCASNKPCSPPYKTIFEALTCNSNESATETTATSSQNSQQSLAAALEAATTLAEKADILAKAAADAVLEVAKTKAEAEAKAALAAKAPAGMLGEPVRKEANKAQTAAAAAEAKAKSLATQAAEAAKIAAVTEVIASEPDAE